MKLLGILFAVLVTLVSLASAGYESQFLQQGQINSSVSRAVYMRTAVSVATAEARVTRVATKTRTPGPTASPTMTGTVTLTPVRP